jgi:hypothetical protein
VTAGPPPPPAAQSTHERPLPSPSASRRRLGVGVTDVIAAARQEVAAMEGGGGTGGSGGPGSPLSPQPPSGSPARGSIDLRPASCKALGGSPASSLGRPAVSPSGSGAGGGEEEAMCLEAHWKRTFRLKEGSGQGGGPGEVPGRRGRDGSFGTRSSATTNTGALLALWGALAGVWRGRRIWRGRRFWRLCNFGRAEGAGAGGAGAGAGAPLDRSLAPWRHVIMWITK